VLPCVTEERERPEDLLGRDVEVDDVDETATETLPALLTFEGVVGDSKLVEILAHHSIVLGLAINFGIALITWKVLGQIGEVIGSVLLDGPKV
jgi:hypothetical protein